MENQNRLPGDLVDIASGNPFISAKAHHRPSPDFIEKTDASKEMTAEFILDTSPFWIILAGIQSSCGFSWPTGKQLLTLLQIQIHANTQRIKSGLIMSNCIDSPLETHFLVPFLPFRAMYSTSNQLWLGFRHGPLDHRFGQVHLGQEVVGTGW